MFPSMLSRLSSELFHSIAYQQPLVIGHGLNIQLNLNKILCCHDRKHALLVSGITVSMYMYLCRQIQPSPCSSPFAGYLYPSKCE